MIGIALIGIAILCIMVYALGKYRQKMERGDYESEETEE